MAPTLPRLQLLGLPCLRHELALLATLLVNFNALIEYNEACCDPFHYAQVFPLFNSLLHVSITTFTAIKVSTAQGVSTISTDTAQLLLNLSGAESTLPQAASSVESPPVQVMTSRVTTATTSTPVSSNSPQSSSFCVSDKVLARLLPKDFVLGKTPATDV